MSRTACSPTELTAFSDRYEDFKKLDAEVRCISTLRLEPAWSWSLT